MSANDFVRTAGELSHDEVAAQMERILKSQLFGHAKSLERFLRYVVARKLAGAEHELKEYTIGLEVFRRGKDYDPRVDAVVRVQAAQLRKKLAAFYETEGAADDIVIDLPKGAYVPHFRRRVTAGPASDETPAGTEAPPPFAPPRRRALQRPGLLFTLPTFLIGVLTVLVFQQWRVVMSSTKAAEFPKQKQAVGENPRDLDPAYESLWGAFLTPGAENILAYGTPQFFVSDDLYFRDVKVNSPGEASHDLRLALLKRKGRLKKPPEPAEIYTGVGETHGLYLLSQFFWQNSWKLSVARNRLVRWEDFKNSNLIFISSMRFQTLAGELPFPTDFTIDRQQNNRAVINLRPQAGEKPVYAGTEEHDYAVITLWPGKSEHRRIMMLSGYTTWATLGAAEYATTREHLLRLNEHLAACAAAKGRPRHSPYFQVLLRVETKDNQPIAESYITHHDLEVAEGGA